jgi:hypothetical protein
MNSAGADSEEILIQFCMDPEIIEDTYYPSWNPSPVRRHLYGDFRLRTEKLHTIDLEWDYSLWMPTRLCLNGIDLFHCSGRAHKRLLEMDGPGPEWFPDDHEPCPSQLIPVVTMPFSVMWGLTRAAKWGEQQTMIANQGDFLFRDRGFQVEVQWWAGGTPVDRKRTSRTPISTVVPYAHLVIAVENFSEDVRRKFLEQFPELAENEEYGQWFREGVEHLRKNNYWTL